MNGDVHVSVEKSPDDLRHEQALQPLGRCGRRRSAIAGRLDRHELRRDAGGAESSGDLVGLREGQPRAPRPNPKAHSAEPGSTSNSSASMRTYAPSVPEPDRSFSWTMGS